MTPAPRRPASATAAVARPTASSRVPGTRRLARALRTTVNFMCGFSRHSSICARTSTAEATAGGREDMDADDREWASRSSTSGLGVVEGIARSQLVHDFLRFGLRHASSESNGLRPVVEGNGPAADSQHVYRSDPIAGIDAEVPDPLQIVRLRPVEPSQLTPDEERIGTKDDELRTDENPEPEVEEEDTDKGPGDQPGRRYGAPGRVVVAEKQRRQCDELAHAPDHQRRRQHHLQEDALLRGNRNLEAFGALPAPRPASLAGDGHDAHYNTATLTLFFVVAFAITWTLFITVAARVPVDTAAGRLLILAGVFSPAIAGLSLIAWKEGAAAARALVRRILIADVPARYYAFAVFYLITIKLGAALLHRIIVDAWPRFSLEALAVAPFAIALSVPVQAGEE